MPRFNDCWNRIGIRGDGSCPELQRHVHCRNCPTYSEAAAKLLDRAAPIGEAAIWRSESASPERLPMDGTESVLIFRVGGEWLGLQSAFIKEIAEERKIHSLPHQRNAAVLGIVNIRGALLLCMSLTRLLNVEKATGEEQIQNRNLFKPMLVTNHGEHAIVFPVDEVDGVHRFSPSALAAIPSTVDHTAAIYTKGILPWRDRTVGVLDGDSLFYALNRSIV
ncbi:chemotaxis protein CheW [Candidimonas sp. SYP-B2681]|uniref:chemotaxis protein CheW n=1 Tax=Candidimonas sp. SYP-B2681 TaxID=2497686 RepID=UPI0013157E7E|nr:chemotaxis protein CheW [Candidimonas sp. SYP-B2681]